MFRAALLTLVISGAACTSGSRETGATAGAPGPDGPPAAVPPPSSADANAPAPSPSGAPTLQPFRAAHVYYDPMDNRRQVYADVDFPAGQWKSVSLQIRLDCPPGGCDRFDRWGYVGVVNGPGPPESITEIARFATPFGGTADWAVDVTPLLPLLGGRKKLVVHIDTWVGPSRPPGAGWLVDVSFTFTPGIPQRTPLQVIPLWDVATFDYGDPAKPVSLGARAVQIPAGASFVELRSLITGHGQGNLQNCAEFCPKVHTYTVGAGLVQRRLWREDCASFCTVVRDPATGSMSCRENPTGAVESVRASRANWCPGATVDPWSIDVTAAARAGTTTTISYSPQQYENTCRPGVPFCQGCALNTRCEYDDGLHTSPKYLHSAVLIVYGSTP